MEKTAHQIAKELESQMQCNCDFDRWVPTVLTGHSHVCRIHKAALEQLRSKQSKTNQ